MGKAGRCLRFPKRAGLLRRYALRPLIPILVRFFLWAGLPVILLLAGSYWYLRQSVPSSEGQFSSKKIKDTIEVTRDKSGVPHILAKNDADAFFAIGFLHAQDRLWQMEMIRRLGAGRLSEILGQNAVERDQMMRTFGFERAVNKAWDHLDDQAKNSLISYANGVNAFLETDPVLPPEFLIFGHKPEPWRPLDSMLAAKIVALNLSMNYRFDLVRIMLTQDVGADIASELLPAYPETAPTIVSQLTLPEGSFESKWGALDESAIAVLQPRAYLGSNAWVVSGDLTQSGKPLLANDPHLDSAAPSLWYFAELKGDQLHVAGATLPGLPYVVFGHNDRIAWGGANMMADTQDLYLERLSVDKHDHYDTGSGQEPMQIYEEEIFVKADFPEALRAPVDPVIWKTRETRHGPLISDIFPISRASERLSSPFALRWTALDADDTSISAILKVNYASDWGSFRQALSSYVTPPMNFVYADVDGNIGYQAAGRLPLRDPNQAMLPAPGWRDEHEWQGNIPFESMPHSFNPQEGYIVSANNRVAPEDYPYYITHDYDYPYRATRIHDLLAAKIEAGKKLTREDMTAIQGDFHSTQADELLPHLLKLRPRNEKEAEAINQLKAWDRNSDQKSVGATIYQAWLFHLGRDILLDNLKVPVAWWAHQIHPEFLLKIMKEQNHPTCDDTRTQEVELCEDMIYIAFEHALVELEKTLGSNMDKWEWGKLHKVQFIHNPLSGANPLISRFFHREISNGGDFYSINVGPPAENSHHRYAQFFMPGFRQVLDLSDWNASLFSNSLGQSGNPFSPHYDDLMVPHRNLEYQQLFFSDDQLKGKQLLLSPQ